MESGIYKIINKINNKCYIGSTKNFKKRFQRHLQMLRKNCHHSIKLQRSYNKYGEDNFIFEIVEECPYIKDIIIDKENYYIKKFNSKENGYNIADASFGDTLSSNPFHDEIIKKRSETIKNNLSKLTKEERSQKYGKFGERNGNFNPNKVVNYCPICGKVIGNDNKTCNEHRNRFGSNNPFYGKHHSDKTKSILKNNMLGKKPVNSKMVSAEGHIFKSYADCAKFFNISVGTVSFRVKSKYFVEWFNISKMPNDYQKDLSDKDKELSRVGTSVPKCTESF